MSHAGRPKIEPYCYVTGPGIHVNNLGGVERFAIAPQQGYAESRNIIFLIMLVQCVPEEIDLAWSLSRSAAALQKRAGDCWWRLCTKVPLAAVGYLLLEMTH